MLHPDNLQRLTATTFKEFLLYEHNGHSANGAEQAVPGMAVMFATFTGSFAGFTFFREQGWHTWDRLRASQATTPDILLLSPASS